MKALLLALFLGGLLSGAGGQTTAPLLRIEDHMHTAISRRVSVDKAGKYILTSSEDKTARLWDAVTGQLLKIFRIPIDNSNEGKIYGCALSMDATKVAIGGLTGYEWDKKECIYIMDVQTGEMIKRLKDIPSIINDIEFSPDGRFLAAALGNGVVYIYHAESLELFKKLEGHDKTLYNLAFDGTGRLVTIGYDGRIRLFDNNFSLLKEAISQAGQKVFSVSFNPKGDLLAVGYTDSKVVELRDGKTLALIASPDITGIEKERGLYVLQFSSDGNFLVGGGVETRQTSNQYNNIIRVWGNGGKGTYTDIPLLKSSISDIKALPNGQFVVLGSYPDIALTDVKGKKLWEEQSGKNKYSSAGKSHFMVSHKGSGLGVTPYEKSAITFDLETRLITNSTADFEPPSDNARGTVVTDWNQKTEAFVNGKKAEGLKNNERYLSTDISSTGQEVILGGDYGVAKTDNNGKRIWYTSVPGAAWVVNIAGNDKIVAAALDDGTIRWYRMTDGKEVLAFYLHADKKRWVLFTPTGYYDASPGAEDLLGWHLNNGPDKAPSFYPLSRFKERFYRPDVIDALFETYYEGDAVKTANIKSNRKEDTRKDDIREKLPPTITISSPGSGTTISTNTVTINYSVSSPADAPVKSVRVMVDGRPVATERGLKVTPSTENKIVVAVPSQNSTVTLLAENDNGTSPEVNLYLKWKTDASAKTEVLYKPKLYVLAIGISDYTNPELKLGYAAKDAGDFVNTIAKQKGALYEDVIVKKLLNKDASKDAITDGLDWIQRQTGQKDMAMIFYAGHGINDNNGIYYMLPVGADLERVRTTCLNFEELKQTVSTIAGKVVVFIDACHSGNVTGGGRRGVSDINSLVNELSSTENGAITFTSSTGKEFSLEDPAWGNGAFTKALIEGLTGKAIVPGKNKITIKSLDAYISERVKEITKGKQHPTSVTPPNVPDFPIGITQ